MALVEPKVVEPKVVEPKVVELCIYVPSFNMYYTSVSVSVILFRAGYGFVSWSSSTD